MRISSLTKRLARVILCILCFTNSIAVAKVYKNTYNSVSDEEIQLLPEYIQARLYFYLGVQTGKVLAVRKLYEDKLGLSPFNPLHHYGLGLIYLRRARMQLTYPNRNFDISSAIGEFAFVIKNSKPESYMLYDVYCRQGEAFLLNNDLANAMRDFHKAIILKPDFRDPYVLLSECFTRAGDPKNAEAILELYRSNAGQSKK